MSTPFCTLRKAVEIAGIGLHTGSPVTARLLPREKAGIIFVRTDMPGTQEVPAAARCIASTHHATTLAHNGATIGTPEHLLAALCGLGISNCRIELNAPEVPILDGSAKQWCELIEQAGLRELEGERPEYSLHEPLIIESRGGAVIGLPHPQLRVTVDVDFEVPYLLPQVFVGNITPNTFQDEIAPARTFALEAWIEPLRSLGLIQGGSLDNALVLDENGPSTPLRFENELARHKALDLLGDMALLFGENGGVLHAHLIAIRAGHELHRLWMEKALEMNLLGNTASVP